MAMKHLETPRISQSTEDVAKVIAERTNLTYDVTVHHKEKSEEINQSLGKLSSLTGAMKIHEVMIGFDLAVKKKNLPNDPFFKAVTIIVSRRRSTIVARDSGSDSDE